MEEKEAIKGYLAVSASEYENRAHILQETFKGEVQDKEVMFPKGLGAEHPFEFERVDKITNNIGIINAAADKIVDAIVGDFTIKVEDDNAQALLDAFVDDSNFKAHLRPWLKEAISKGNGIMELDLDENRIRVLNANNMYVKRNKKGEVLEWNQFIGKLSTFLANKSKMIPFKPERIAHLPINKIPGDPYGLGLVWTNRVSIEHYAGAELDLHKLLSRKAGAPIHIQVGVPGEAAQSGDIDSIKGSMQYMTNSTEWVTDANVQMKTIDFSGIGDNLTNAAMHDLEQIAIGMKIPMSLLGVANIPEGLAKVNDKGFKRFIKSVRTLAEEIIEDKILQPFLRNNKLKFKIEFEWELQDEDEKNERLKVITETMKNPFISPVLKAGLELEYAEIVGLDEVINVLPNPSEAKVIADKEEAETRAREREEQTIKQPEVPGAKPTANSSLDIKSIQKNGTTTTNLPANVDESDKSDSIQENFHKCTESCGCTLTESEAANMSIAEYVNLQELAGFNYSDYLVKILVNLRTEKFDDLLALTEQQLSEGLLPKKDIDKLRVVLSDGFRKNKTIRQIENDIKQSIDLPDRVKFEEDGEKKITLHAEKRPNVIARTETVRLANAGLKDMYIENDIKSYRYLAALDDRTSDICNSLNGQVFLVKDGTPGVNMPPMHVNCRSSIIGLLDT
jgi:SPP1 gp7 family putative phage head morphogenesis protein